MELSPGLATVTGMPTSFPHRFAGNPGFLDSRIQRSDTAVALEAELGPDRPWVGRLCCS
jgi:hypothetical protein